MSRDSFGRALDTTVEASAMQVERWRMMSSAQKVALVVGMSNATRQLAERGMRARYPNASAREIFLRLAILQLGRELAIAAYPEAAELTS